MTATEHNRNGILQLALTVHNLRDGVIKHVVWTALASLAVAHGVTITGRVPNLVHKTSYAGEYVFFPQTLHWVRDCTSIDLRVLWIIACGVC